MGAKPETEREARAMRTDLTSCSGEQEVATGNTRDVVGSAIGMSGATYQRAKE